MPLFDEDSACPLCFAPLGSEPTIGFDCLLVPDDHEVHTFPDCLVHRVCLSRWEERDRFVRAWNALLAEQMPFNHRLVVRDGDVQYERVRWVLVSRIRRWLGV